MHVLACFSIYLSIYLCVYEVSLMGKNSNSARIWWKRSTNVQRTFNRANLKLMTRLKSSPVCGVYAHMYICVFAYVCFCMLQRNRMRVQRTCVFGNDAATRLFILRTRDRDEQSLTHGHTHIRTYIHTYIHTYIIRTNIQSHTNIPVQHGKAPCFGR